LAAKDLSFSRLVAVYTHISFATLAALEVRARVRKSGLEKEHYLGMYGHVLLLLKLAITCTVFFHGGRIEAPVVSIAHLEPAPKDIYPYGRTSASSNPTPVVEHNEEWHRMEVGCLVGKRLRRYDR
jgi:hypothetical protein